MVKEIKKEFFVNYPTCVALMVYPAAMNNPELYAILCRSKLVGTWDLLSAGNERGRHILNLLVLMPPQDSICLDTKI